VTKTDAAPAARTGRTTARVGWLAALAGIGAAVTALGVGELLAAAVSPRSSPLVAVGGVVVDNVPEAGKQFAIDVFGTNDKLALQVGTVVLLCAFAALLGAVGLRRIWLGLAGIVAFGAVGTAAALTRTGASWTWALPSVVGTVAAVVTLWALLSFLARSVVGPDGRVDRLLLGASPSPAPEGLRAVAARRRFLQAAGAAVGGGAALGVLGHFLGQTSGVNQARDAVAAKLPEPSGSPVSPIPEADVADLKYVTSNPDFYRIDTALVVPRVDPAEWKLTINGRVQTPLTLTFDELLKLPTIERYVTLTCVSNEIGGDLIGNARWLGVPIADLLDRVQPHPAADQVVSFSVDGFTAGTPTAALRDGRDAMLAIAMNGEPLPVEHGFPVRMVVPGLYGYVSATKWLARLELTTFADYDAYWIPRGWAQQAPIKTGSRIDRPRGGSRVAAGEVVVAGVAWAQHRGIGKVEVRVDRGAWQPATLAAVASVDTWRLWSWRWSATPGSHVLDVRAFDNAGAVQIEAEAPPAPDGATGYHRINVQVG
jgi:DMSO/TMAO reductase YedYZ molybdopterin-dependent catalytic subunit